MVWILIFLFAACQAEYNFPNLTIPIFPEGRIHGGKVTGGLVHSAVAFVHKYATSVSAGCTGSYLGDNWVLTASHCKDTIADTDVYLGTYDLRKPSFVTKVKKVWPAPSWGKTNDKWDGDLAMVELVKAPGRLSKAKPMCLSDVVSVNYKSLTAYGWGRTSCKGPSSMELKETLGSGQDTCAVMRDNMKMKLFCVKFDKGGIPDHGDSGGPIMLNGLQVGVASSVPFDKNDCPMVWLASMYSRVSGYFDFIKSKYPRVCIKTNVAQGKTQAKPGSGGGKPSSGCFGLNCLGKKKPAAGSKAKPRLLI